MSVHLSIRRPSACLHACMKHRRASACSPISILRHVYRPGDFVAFKLDIDAEELENILFSEFEGDEYLRSAVAEFYFEQVFPSAGVPQPTLESRTV
jgi:hypothetical protein